MVADSETSLGPALAPVPGRPLPSTPRALFDALPPLECLRAEIIDGRLTVSRLGTIEHARAAMQLFESLIPIIDERGWHAWTRNVDVCIDGTHEPVVPDFVLAPVNCTRWGGRELLSSGLKLVAEVVSPGSAHDDRELKPDIYARGGVPVMLLIDPLAESGTVTVFSEPKEGRYQVISTVTFGREIYIPDPIDFTLDTSVFKEVL
ncbi:Uma2 family endonuclease [Sphaerimonospora cavernae]|uniref:Uma2 family endonuclease n=1 Tax=Sphaerimonospora cavernae TaxID=1740611 RepID=A0ABV6U9Y7_9ACTN